MTRISQCILYRNFSQDWILTEMCGLIDRAEDEGWLLEHRESFYRCLNGLVEMAADYGFSGNLWQDYLTYLLVNHENAFSRACEIVGPVEGSVSQLARHDFAIIRELFETDLSFFDRVYHHGDLAVIENYVPVSGDGKLFNRRIRDRICTLSRRLGEAGSTEEFMTEVVEFYRDFGVGKLGLHKAFRVQEGERGAAEIVPIHNGAHVYIDDLVGYELAKKKLTDNTEAFVEGRRANNCLLFGDAGTGKSSSIKGILNQYYDKGLRIIEIYKHQFCYLNDVIAQIKNRNYKFIIYMDDLSFEEFETEYKYLKAVIEGGLEKKPDNILIYATSNRRHLIKESFADKEGRRDQLHSSDTVQEKLSLVTRFGVTIFFCAPDKKEFQAIVKALAQRSSLRIGEEELLAEANKWEVSHGGLSGRTAQQFIDYLLGQQK